MAIDIAALLDGKSVADIGDAIPDEVRGKSPEQLHQLVEVLDAHLRSLHQDETTGELRDLSDSEEKALYYGLKIREAAMKRIEEHRALSEVFARRPESVKRVYANLNHGIDASNGVVRMSNNEARDMALRTLDQRNSSAHLDSTEKDQIEKHVRKNTDIARRIIATENDDYRNAFLKMTTKVNGSIFLNDEERQALAIFDEYRAMSEGSNGAGGFGIPVFIDPSIILSAQGSGNPFLQIAKSVDVNTNNWKGINSAGVTWAFQAEAAAATDTSPTLLQPTITIFMARGFIPYSIEVGQDYPGFASEMTTLLAEGYDELLVDKFTRGNGTTEPQGVLTAVSAATACRVGVQTSGTNFGANDPYAVWGALPQRFRRKASWLMSVDVNNKLRQLGTANVFHAYTVNIPTEWADTFYGKATYESPYMPNTTTSTSANSGLALVGDFFNGFTIARRAGMNVELMPLLVDVTSNFPTGQRGWFAYARIGSGVVNTSAFRLLVNT